MSAFIVSDKHIDALLRYALAYPRSGGLHWFASDSAEAGDYERGEPWGRTAVANAQARVREITHENASHIGRMLLLENHRSVGHRYDEPLELPAYNFNITQAPTLTPVEVLSIISCYEYQSCEHPGWEHSQAKAFCSALRHKMISHLPGYDEAPWGL